MTVSQMTAVSSVESKQQRLQWQAEQVLRWSGLPVVQIRPTVLLENPLFTTLIARSLAEEGVIRLPFGGDRTSPVAAEDVATAVSRVAMGSPLSAAVELAGPEPFRFDEFIRRGLISAHDPREVIADPNARYFGTELSERSLVPDNDHALLGEIRFQDWLSKSVSQANPTNRQPTVVAAASKGTTNPK